MREFLKQKDKQKHILYSTLLTMGLSGVLLYVLALYCSIVLAMFFTTMIGVSKELYDSLGSGTEDIGDIYADVIGVLAGGVVVSAIYIVSVYIV